MTRETRATRSQTPNKGSNLGGRASDKERSMEHCVVKKKSSSPTEAPDFIQPVAAPPGKTGRIDRAVLQSGTGLPSGLPEIEPNRAYVLDSLTSQSGVEWVKVGTDRKQVWLRHSDLSFEGRVGMATLKAAGVLLFGAAAQKQLIEDVAQMTHFPGRVVIEASGWTGNHFCMPDGATFSPEGDEPPLSVFHPQGARVAIRGSYGSWRRRVANLVAGHPIPEFALCAGFAASLLHDSPLEGNVGFDLSGASSNGKTSLQRLVASSAGPPSGREGRYMQSYNATANGLQDTMPYYSDLPLILDELGLATTGGTRKAQDNVRDIVMRLADGVPRRRSGDSIGDGMVYRTVFISSSNHDLRNLLRDLPADQIDAALVRLIQIPIPKRPEGVFDRAPQKFDDVPALLSELGIQSASHHGAAMRRFVGRLVQHRSNDVEAFRQTLRSRIDDFIEQSGAQSGSGVDVRVAMAFGLVVFAGELAQQFRVLPGDFNPMSSALECYRLHRTTIRQRRTVLERLGEILRREHVYDLRVNERPDLTDEEMDVGGIFISHGVGKRTEVWLSEGCFGKHFPDRASVLASSEAHLIMITDKKRKGGTYRVPRAARKARSSERVFCFKVPADLY